MEKNYIICSFQFCNPYDFFDPLYDIFEDNRSFYFEIRFPIYEINEYKICKIKGENFLMINSFSRPLVFEREDTFIYREFYSYTRTDLTRHTDISSTLQMGQATCYFFKFHRNYIEKVENIMERLSKYNKIEEFFGYSDVQLARSTLNSQIYTTFMQKLSPENGYYLNCLISNDYLFKEHLSIEALEKLHEFSDSPKRSELFIRQFFDDLFFENYQINWETNLDGKLIFVNTIESWKNSKLKKPFKIDIPEGSFLIKTILITPLAIYYHLPQYDTGNRVVRNFKIHSDKFVRVHFVDENGFDLIYHTEKIGERMKKIIKNGIKIGKFSFSFLAFSNAQLRTQSLWMFSETKRISCSMIRSWMGDFSKIKNVAKYSARLGQCFSSTTQTIKVQRNEFIEVQDFKTPDGKYIFSDGCGIISSDFAKDICKCLPSTKKKKNKPIAFQLRFAGYKGVVVAYDLKSLGIKGNYKLVLRESMKKFDSSHFTFEVIRTSSFRPCYLNKQIISLLSTRLIKDEVFIKHQDSNIEIYDKMLEDKEIAIKCLGNYAVEDNKIGKIIKSLLKNNWRLDEPFVHKALDSISRFKKMEVKTKTKIFIENGSILLGVCDESRTLKYGQVFVRIQKKDQDEPITIKGNVAIAKNPCFHPGDCRVLEAIEVDELNHLVNVVVFPTLGKRDHPNECSGSDLDGDTYTVIWEKDLVPKTENFDPMDYTASKAKEVNEITINEISNFFVDSMKNNNLGRISNAHIANYAFEGLTSKECLKLANLQSVAVDFPKTGVPAVFSNDLKPKLYPLFMEKEEDRSAESNCVIEKLYLKASKNINKIGDKNSKIGNLEIDEKLLFDGYKEYLKQAKDLFDEYSRDLNRFLRQYKIRSEFDILSMFFIKYVKQLKNKKHGLKKVKEAFQNLIENYKSNFVIVSKTKGLEEEKLKLASAMYFVCYNNKVSENRRSQWKRRRRKWKKPLKIISFPYVIAFEQLIKIKMYNESNIEI